MPALKKGLWVLCDRCSPSTIAYQHFGRGLDLFELRAKDEDARQHRNFDFVIFMDMKPEKALSRKGTVTRFEQEAIDFHERVYKGFVTQANLDPDRWFTVDASKSIGEISDLIRNEVRKRFFVSFCGCAEPVGVVGSPIDTVETCKNCGKIIKDL
jgi:dTMP kinase